MALGGVVIRPTPNDGYPPTGGTRVTWRAHAQVQNDYDQAKAGGLVVVKGVIGNADHLYKHGGHTPWEPGKPLGVVHAGDWEADELGDLLIDICRSNTDTSEIQFFNWRSSQYNYAGQRIGPSADWHLHLHYKAYAEHRRLNLIKIYNELHGGIMTDPNTFFNTQIDIPGFGRGSVAAMLSELYQRSGGRGQIQAILAELREMIVDDTTDDTTYLAKLDEIEAKVEAGPDIALTDEQLNTLAEGVATRVADRVVAETPGLSDTDVQRVRDAAKLAAKDALREGSGTA